MFIVAVVALVASGLTMFSGFGLGTLLMPAFAIFFPVDLAIAATAVVHGANGVLKAVLLGGSADRRVIWRFGVPAVLAALVGAWVLGLLAGAHGGVRYTVLGVPAQITPVKAVMGALMAVFAVLELHPRFAGLRLDHAHLGVGGVLSGFFGGLSGHQGALRSAFLSKAGLSPAQFVGTNAVIGVLVDLTRLSAYATLAFGGRLTALADTHQRWVIGVATLAAFAGVLIGKRLLRTVTMRSVQLATGGLLLLVAVLLGFGLI